MTPLGHSGNDYIRRRLIYASITRRGLFPPVRRENSPSLHNKGSRKTTHMTVNGRLAITREVYWNKQSGSVVPVDKWLGIDSERYSPGVREMCCLLAANSDFRKLSEDLKRAAQIEMAPETGRQIVEREGLIAVGAVQEKGFGPDWTSQDCREVPTGPSTVITGADGVMVPLVTEGEKAKRRALRRKAGAKPRGRRKSIGKGSSQAYKEFKILAFYDPQKKHKHVVGTSGDHNALGRLMRREGAKVKLDKADEKYSVSDGAVWILKQYQSRLPMLDGNVLDYYHLKQHVTATSCVVYGEGSDQAEKWREEMMGVVMEEGPVRLIERLGELRRSVRSSGKRKSIAGLQKYVTERAGMLDYPEFRSKGWDIGSGPTEGCCKNLTARLKGSGMKWDEENAEGMMALAAIDDSGLWKPYWQARRAA